MSTKTPFIPVRESLASLAGREYCEAVVAARSALTGTPRAELRRLARERVDFFPQSMQRRQAQLLASLGRRIAKPLAATAAGAASRRFREATRTELAPVNGFGCFRVGEDGRLYLISKSEHYHAPLGHSFPGYGLVDRARQLGIPNATHNNTRGYITRRAEEELVRVAAGVAPGVVPPAPALSRVINLETGSLVCEAAIKMMLARFYRIQADSAPPTHAGRVPVFLVMGNDDGGLQGNYHGTTVLAQCLRGMWPELQAAQQRGALLQVRPLRPNRLEDAAAAFAEYSRAPYQIAGFLHELIMMNYGAVALEPAYIQGLYRLCAQHAVPTLCDEIQSCLWAPGLFLFREYGIVPDFVAIGKGFPGGEYAASRILFNARYDSLPQFGALVTNGQEELASLAYLVTMRWAEVNTPVTQQVGEYFANRLGELAAAYPGVLARVSGSRHLQGLHFQAMGPAKTLVQRLTAEGLDISVQSYKTECPPVALLKLPLIAGYDVVDTLLAHLKSALHGL